MGSFLSPFGSNLPRFLASLRSSLIRSHSRRRPGREPEGRPEGAGLTSRPGLRREGVTELNEDTSSEVNRVCLSSFPLTLHSARYAVYVNGEGRIVNGRIERE